jgi:hypothetical protein
MPAWRCLEKACSTPSHPTPPFYTLTPTPPPRMQKLEEREQEKERRKALETAKRTAAALKASVAAAATQAAVRQAGGTATAVAPGKEGVQGVVYRGKWAQRQT